MAEEEKQTERWTLYECPTCREIGGPVFQHAKGCPNHAEPVEVVPAQAAERLAETLELIASQNAQGPLAKEMQNAAAAALSAFRAGSSKEGQET